MRQHIADLGLPAGLVLLMSLCATLTLPILPVDETRYTSVAWDMWNTHSFLVPRLNGAPYSHKPPLLFWLMHAGWALFGVNEITPRLLPGLFSLLNLILVYQISLNLWPQERKIAAGAALVLASTALWAVWSVAIMFDMVLTFWTLLGLLGTLRAAKRESRGWLMLTVGIGGGLLTKGPAVLVYLLSIPLLRPLWDVRNPCPIRARWHWGVLGALALGLAAALLWVVPAALLGGETYRHELLWGQTVNRVASSFAHRRPFWWYLPIVPLLFFPWILFRPSFAKIRLKTSDTGTRFCWIWLGAPLFVFSLISGKQIHYLIPFIPAGALLIGRNIALRVPSGTTQRAARTLALSLALILIVVLFGAKPRVLDGYDMKEVAAFIKKEMDAGHRVAHIGKYHGQFHFLGRLTDPIHVIGSGKEELDAFAKNNPGALFISYQNQENALPEKAEIGLTHRYRGKTSVALWRMNPNSFCR